MYTYNKKPQKVDVYIHGAWCLYHILQEHFKRKGHE